MSPQKRSRRSSFRRRTFLASAAGTTVALAGCLGGNGNGSENSSNENDTSTKTKTGNGNSSENGGKTDKTSKLDFSGERLTVLVWSGNYADRFKNTVKPLYEEKTGAVLDVKTGWNDVAKRIANNQENIDVSITEGSFYQIAQNQDSIHTIREENIPNLSEVIDYYKEFRPTSRAVPVDGAPCTIIHRKDLGFEIETWEDVVGPKAQATTGIGIDYGFWAFPLHAIAIGMNPENDAAEIYEGKLDAVLERMSQMNITGWATGGNEIWKMFEKDQIDIAQWYFEQVHFDIDFQGPDLTHTTPQNSPGFLNHWTVVRGTKKRRMAEHFLNFLLDAETQTEWAKSNPSMYTNENMTYPSDLGKILPSNGQEAKEIVFPDWEPILTNWETFQSEIDKIKAASTH